MAATGFGAFCGVCAFCTFCAFLSASLTPSVFPSASLLARLRSFEPDPVRAFADFFLNTIGTSTVAASLLLVSVGGNKGEDDEDKEEDDDDDDDDEVDDEEEEEEEKDDDDDKEEDKDDEDAGNEEEDEEDEEDDDNDNDVDDETAEVRSGDSGWGRRRSVVAELDQFMNSMLLSFTYWTLMRVDALFLMCASNHPFPTPPPSTSSPSCSKYTWIRFPADNQRSC